MDEIKVTYSVNGVEFDRIEDVMTYQRQKLLDRLKDNHKRTIDLINEYTKYFDTNEDKKKLFEALGVVDNINDMLDEFMKALGFND